MTARFTIRRKNTRNFSAGPYLPALDPYDYINGQGVADLVRAALPYLDADDKKDLGMGVQPDGDKVGEHFEIGKFIPTLSQVGTYDLVEAALAHLDADEVIDLVVRELSPRGRAKLLKRLREERWNSLD